MSVLLSPGILTVIVPALLVVAVIAARSRAGLGWIRVLVAAVLRAAVALGLIYALARPAQMDARLEPRALIVLFDVSDSVPASARRAALDDLARYLQTTAQEPGLSVTLMPFAGAPLPLASFPASAPAPLGELERAVLLWDSEGKKLRRELDALREQPGSDAPQTAGGTRRVELEKLVARLDDALARLRTDRTDLTGALAAATGLDPTAAARSLVLFTDGRWDAPADPAWGAFAGAFERIRVVPLEAHGEVDLVVRELAAPTRVRTGEPFDVRVTLACGAPAHAELQLLVDSRLVAEREVVFPGAGVHEASFPDLTLGEGLHRFQVVARRTDGEEPETRNNTALGAVDAVGRPRVALVEGAAQSSVNFGRALAAQDFEIVPVAAADFPTATERLGEYQIVAFAEPSEKTLSAPQWEALRDWVSEGGGLYVLTGVDGKSLAGVRKSPLAPLLPVQIPEPDQTPPKTEDPPPDPKPEPTPEKKDPIKAEAEAPTIALVLAIDRSGSMQGQKLLLAKESVIASAKALRPEDLVGVIAFDTQAHWVVTLTPARRIDYIVDRVSRVKVGGGTSIYPALVAAYRDLHAVEAQVKHVILLTDGYTEMEDFSGLIEKMVADKITISTVGVGDDFDGVLLANLSKWGKGTYDFTAKAEEVPTIFIRETRRAARIKDPSETGGKPPTDAVAARPPETHAPKSEPPKAPDAAGRNPEADSAPVAGPDAVIAPAPGPLTEGLDRDKLPALERFAVTELRPQAAAPLITKEGKKPVLAFWRYGLGKVLVWTSDLREKGAPAWARWESLPKFAARSLRFAGSVREDLAIDVQTRVLPGPERETVTLSWSYPSLAAGGTPPATVTATLPSGTEEKATPLIPHRSGPLGFAVDVPVAATGRVVPVEVKHVARDGKELTQRFGLARSYPEELRDRGPDAAGVALLGRLLAIPPDAAADAPCVAPARPVRRFEEKGPSLILVLVFFFFTETIIRKFKR